VNGFLGDGIRERKRDGEAAARPAAGELGAIPLAETTIGRSCWFGVDVELVVVVVVVEEDGCERVNGYLGGMVIGVFQLYQ
jgi:hypothetical protein